MPAPQRVTFCRRRKTLFRKASALYEHAGARAAIIVLSSKGKLYSSGDLSVEETAQIISDYVSCKGGSMPPMGLKEKADWVKKQRRRTEIAKSADRVRMLRSFSNRLETLCNKATELCTKTDARAAVIVFPNTGSLYSDTEIPYCFGIPSVEDVISHWVEKQLKSCVTKEDFDSLNLKYEPVLRYVMREKLKDISGSGNSGVGVDDYEVLYDEEIHSLLESFKASCPSLLAHFENCARNGDHDGILTSPANLAAGGGSSGVESIPMHSDLEDCGFDLDDFLNLSEEFVCDGFLIVPENSTVDSGSSREESTCFDLEGYGYNSEVFPKLDDLNVSLVI